MAIKRYLVEPQPVIPEGVTDLVTRWEDSGRVWSLHSEGQGVDLWADIRRNVWKMPEQMVAESRPDAIEYWRAVSPYWREDRDIDLVFVDDNWWWAVTPKHVQVVGKGLKKMAKDKLTKEQERVLRALALKDDWMSAYELQCQMGTLYSLSSRRNYVIRDVMREGDIAFPRQINWQITTVGREVIAQLDKEQQNAGDGE